MAWHGKPHREQGQIGEQWRGPRCSRVGCSSATATLRPDEWQPQTEPGLSADSTPFPTAVTSDRLGSGDSARLSPGRHPRRPLWRRISPTFPHRQASAALMCLAASSCALLSMRGNPLFLSGNSFAFSPPLFANPLWSKEKSRLLLERLSGWGYSARRCRKVGKSGKKCSGASPT